MSRQEALRELGLSDGSPDAAAIKAAYRKRSLATHPDKGGSSEEFVRVAQAYEVLTSPDGGASSGGAQHSSSQGGRPMTPEEQMKFAEDLFFQQFADFLENSDSTADKAVEWLFKQFFEKPPDNTGKSKETKSVELPFQLRLLKRVMKWTARHAFNAVKSFAESDTAQININGQTLTGADLKKLRELLRRRAAAAKKPADTKDEM